LGPPSQLPGDRNDQGRNRIEDEAPAERLAVELVEPREGAEGQKADEQRLEADVQPEEQWTVRGIPGQERSLSRTNPGERLKPRPLAAAPGRGFPVTIGSAPWT